MWNCCTAILAKSRTWVEALWEDSKGGVLAAMQPRIGEFAFDAKPGAVPRWRHTYENGLVDTSHTSITEDVAGNLWVGCEGCGAIRISRTGFVSYDRPDGLGGTRVASIFEDRAGELLAVTGEPTRLNLWDGSRFKALEINFPPGVPVGWGLESDRASGSPRRMVDRYPTGAAALPGPSRGRSGSRAS